jgi:ABC-type uncharacterized transport system ATPase subunit
MASYLICDQYSILITLLIGEAMIQLHKVSVQYGSFAALHSTTLAFVPGQFTVLLGASGAGNPPHCAA